MTDATASQPSKIQCAIGRGGASGPVTLGQLKALAAPPQPNSASCRIWITAHKYQHRIKDGHCVPRLAIRPELLPTLIVPDEAIG